jgi:hypothetical protein
MQQGPIKHLHGFQFKILEHAPHLFPQSAFAPKFFPNGLKKGATQLLSLIHKESQHHEQDKVGTRLYIYKKSIFIICYDIGML